MTSVFLLGGKRGCADEPAYLRLMGQLSQEGDFLSPEQDASALACYDRDSQSLHSMRPLLVFRPYSLASIPLFIHACASLRIPLTVRCGGTGRAGASVASQGGVVALTGHFRSILDYDKSTGVIRIEPGVTARQINQRVCEDGWVLPLEMDTAGVAGLAGCLSAAAKGYHQSCVSLAHAVISVTFIDGTGQEHHVPGSFLYGSEGMFGVITQMTIQLSPIPQTRRVFQFESDLDSLIQNENFFQQFSTLSALTWHPSHQMHMALEGETWRVEQAANQIGEQYQIREISSDWRLSIPSLSQNSSFLISQFLPLLALPRGLSYLEKQAKACALAYDVWYNVLDESLHLFLFNQESAYAFKNTLERFLAEWGIFLREQGGYFASRHGIGPFLSRYMAPFMKEEDVYFLKKLQKAFDPSQIFAHQHFLGTRLIHGI